MEKTSCYSKVQTQDNNDWVEAEKVCYIGSTSTKSSVHRNQYPGLRRTAAAAGSPFHDNADMVLVKTAGNALKAVSRQDLSLMQSNNNNNNNIRPETAVVLLSVVVPPNMKAGDALHVQVPDDGHRILAVTIPPGLYPGQSFRVKVPPAHHVQGQQQQQQPQQQPNEVFTPPPRPPPSTDTIPFSQALNSNYATIITATPAATTSNSSTSQHPSNSNTPPTTAASSDSPGNGDHDGDLILVQVPPGHCPGAKLQVQVPNGRWVEATVPHGNVQQFYMRLPTPSPATQHGYVPVARPIFP